MNTIKFSNCRCEVKCGEFNINEIPLDCSATWNLISSGHTVGVFQLEKKLGQDWARRVKPSNIEELAALVSLLRPGPLEAGMSQDYVDVKFGKKKAAYLHPYLKPILESTYGCLVYQEQALRIAVEIAGYSSESADKLRKAIGKKKPEMMPALRKEFVEGAEKKGLVSTAVASEIFGWIEKCQRYSFNKSHAVSYAMIGYQTAWLKCHFPKEFFTSYLTYSHYKTNPKEEIYKLVQDARLFGIKILPPDIRRRNVHFEMIPDGIAFGLAHIRGVGQSAIQKIVSAGSDSSDNGSQGYSLETWKDFLAAVPIFHRNVGEALIKSGACDLYNPSRSEMLRELELVLGTTTRDVDGKKKEIRGLTAKERNYFFKMLSEGKTTKDGLIEMLEKQAQKSKPLSQMRKDELVQLAQKMSIELGQGKITKADLIDKIKNHGYKIDTIDVRLTEKRKAIIADKIDKLKINVVDTNKARATAEKYFLGISLSCSPADDVDNDLATHTCLEAAKAQNKCAMTICAIIDSVKNTKTRRGDNPGRPMCFLTISDSSYSIDHAVVFPVAYNQLKALCKENLIGLIYGEKRNGSFIVSDIQKLI